jgi:thiol-disulfide isomerase/thioredoxin
MELENNELNEKQQFLNILKNKTTGLIVKFTADWCGPCKKSAPFIKKNLSQVSPNTIQYLEIDIDESIEVYGFLKSKRMISSIPCLMYYKKETSEIWPDHLISSSSEKEIDNFFKFCIENQ